MKAKLWIGALLAQLLFLAACSKHERAQEAGAYVSKNASPEADGTVMRAPAGTFLAYEHSISLVLPVDSIPDRIAQTQASCLSQKFGDCAVLNVSQQGGDYPQGSLTVRIAPKGVEPMIRQAGNGGEIEDRSTRAEDLAQVVQDNAAQRHRLENEHSRLMEFQARRDLAVGDVIALSKQLSEVESQLELTQREGAQHQRRIDTNLLTLNFRPPGGESGRSEIGQAVRDFGEILALSTAWTIRAAAFLIPVVVVFAVLLGLWRWRRRARTTRH